MKKLLTIVIPAAVITLVIAPTPALGDPAANAEGSAYGLSADGPAVIPAVPTTSVSISSGSSHDENDLVLVPSPPTVDSATLHVEADGAADPAVAATLSSLLASASGGGAEAVWSGRGYAVTESLQALSNTLTADAIEAEATAACVGGDVEFGAAARVVNLTVAGQTLATPLDDQVNQVLLDAGGIRIVLWETNWDPASGTTTDGADRVWVNGLHVTVEATLATLATDLVISHAEASATCPVGGGGGGPVDTDGDGIDDGDEIVNGTDPNDPDSDDDGLDGGPVADTGDDSVSNAATSSDGSDGSEGPGAGRPVTTPDGGVPASGDTPSLTGTRAPLPFTGSAIVPVTVLAVHLVLAGCAFLLIADVARRRGPAGMRAQVTPLEAWRIVRSPEVRRGESTLRCVYAASVIWSDRWRRF